MGVDYTQMAVEWNNIVDEQHKQDDLVFLWKKTPEHLRAYDKGCRRRQNQNATVRPSLERIGRLMRRLREEIPPRSRLEVEREAREIVHDLRGDAADRSGDMVYVAHQVAAPLQPTSEHLDLPQGEDGRGTRRKRRRKVCNTCGRFQSNSRAREDEHDEWVEQFHVWPSRGNLECRVPREAFVGAALAAAEASAEAKDS